MFEGIFNVLFDFISGLSSQTVYLISRLVEETGSGTLLNQMDINLILFSDIPILSTDLEQLLAVFFSIFYSMFFIILLYKVTKKFITMVFGVFRV